MSLFDVIKYPINDIFNEEEMSKIPVKILQQWVSENNQNKTKFTITKDANSVLFSLIARVMVVEYIGGITLYSYSDIRCKLEDEYKRRLTEHLRYLIAEFDSDSPA